MVTFHPLSNISDDPDVSNDYLVIQTADQTKTSIKFSQKGQGGLDRDYYEFGRRVKLHLASLLENEEYDEIFESFLDIRLQSRLGLQNIIGVSKLPKDFKLRKENKKACLQLAAMYKAIFNFLEENERVKELDARLMLVYSAWQWLSFLKIVSNNYQYESCPVYLIDELSQAYKSVNNYFQDPDYKDSFRFIYYWATSNNLDSGLDEFLIYSMVLMPSPGLYASDESTLNYRLPIPPYGYSDHKHFGWHSVILHPVFKEHRPAKVAIMRLVTHYALPSYDFDAALHLAHLLQTNQPMKTKHPIWLFILAIFAIVFIPVFINNTIQPIDVPFPYLNTLPTSLAVTTFFVGLVGSVWYLIKTYSNDLIIHLLLPRVWAGILVGFSTLIFESGSVDITCTLWEARLSIVVLWLIMVAISWFYLYHDILPWAIDKRETRTRTVQTLGITLLLSVLIGFIVIPLSTMTYNDPCDYCGQILFNGIFGKVDIKQLLVFVPLAYITGLISQFIFEEKPLTTSVWAPVRE